ncbi:family 16 glycoside hydrolase [Thermogemmatispora onikobensis]|uniref:family 16 glycoside hydrolase n=1 Tax=Thermogemmatispora onikobensis TaxID=732234 RepID=UPI000853489B|nr:family 16 glycoside hydrolase [Thermogemmatispora onikobensis]
MLVLVTGSLLALALVGSALILFLSLSHQPATNHSQVAASPSPSPSPDVLVQARPAAAPLFSDNFADNSKGWDTTGGPGFSKTIANHALTMTDRNHRILVAPLPIRQTFSDFQITVDMTLESGDGNDSMGIYMRGDDQLANDYRVDIFGDATYAISKEVTGLDGNTQVRILSGIASHRAIKPLGQQNEVTVIIKGNQIVLGVNGHLIASVTDSSYSNGMIALFVSNGTSSPAATAAITSVAVYPAPSQLP